MEQLSDGLWRTTFPLPWELDHVHSYLLESDEGWTIVDTGLGSTRARELWSTLLAALDGPVARIVVTHFHPDHIGSAAYLGGLTGAPVNQGAVDHATAKRVWGDPDWPDRLSRWYALHGLESELAENFLGDASRLRDNVSWPREPEIVEPGDRIAAAGEEWEFAPMPGHADGQLVLFGTSTGRLIAGDHILTPITPNIGLHPEMSADPLGDYIRSLDSVVALSPTQAYGGHHEPIPDAVARAIEIKEHHAERLDHTLDVVGSGTPTAYEVSLGLFGDELGSHGRRFALAESLSHLARLEHDGVLRQDEANGHVRWSKP